MAKHMVVIPGIIIALKECKPLLGLFRGAEAGKSDFITGSWRVYSGYIIRSREHHYSTARHLYLVNLVD